MLRKLILTAVLGTVALGTAAVSYAQTESLAWTGEFRPFLDMSSGKYTGATGQDKSLGSTQISTYAETILNYKSKTVNDWYATATLGIEWTHGSSGSFGAGGTPTTANGSYTNGGPINYSGIDLGENWNVTVGNSAFGVKLGNTKYLDSVADMGGYYTLSTVGGKPTIGGQSVSGPAMSTAVDDGDESSRIGNIGFEIRGLPVVVKAGVGTQSQDVAVNSGSTKVTQATTEFGLLVKYAASDFSAGLMFVSNTNDDPTAAVGNTALANKEAKTTLVAGGNYNLASHGVPLNLWLAVKSLTDKTTTDTSGATITKGSAVKTGNGGTQINLGLRYSFLGSSQVGFNYASTTFDKVDGSTYNKSPVGTNMALWVNYVFPFGTAAYASYSQQTVTSELKSSTGVVNKSGDWSYGGFQVGLNQPF